MKRSVLVSLLIAAVLIPVAAASSWRAIGDDTAHSVFQGAIARASVKAPVALQMRAVATPKISSIGSYIVACRKGSKRYDARSSQPFIVNTPLTKTLPVPVKGADRCDITATVQENVQGKLKVTIYAKT